MTNSRNVAAVRKALSEAVNSHGMPLDCRDVETLAKAAADATEWMDSDQIANAAGRTGHRSLSDWCVRYGVERITMGRRVDVERALAAMPGRGRRHDLHPDESETA